ncbi:glycosyltransferase family 4 protein [Algoriphagus aestuariicola]|uniref:Glycosyltransferase family 4 protein n=1 Tax=Algoriphagus aestuariicola TaxID=1852016 RepID=A0ABS3BSZ8_9BACT|nr:glycosyltransferase family 1 protein [Algoriphagus aestuariicola]MBN7801949.1 glycosyltransferase family 4 protein [Algoriphagus aestuariicola]
MKRKVVFDASWDGETGIGRLYREVMARKPDFVESVPVRVEKDPAGFLAPFRLAQKIKEVDGEVFYSPTFIPPLFSQIPFVFTIHDLMHLFYYSRLHREYYRWVIGPLSKKAKKIITVSNYSKSLLIEKLGVPDDLVRVIYNGVGQNFFDNEREYALDRPYFLYVGNRRNYKNLPAMMEAFSRADIPRDFVFALSGHPNPEIENHIRQIGLEGRVRFLGRIPEEDLPAIYKGAHATLFVSKMEGFGLPVLESMASGTPVLTSSASSLPEIAGGAAICVDPEEVKAIQQGIELLVKDEAVYVSCVEKGLQRANDFSWEKTAYQTWDTILG